jgi:hypothetical protein
MINYPQDHVGLRRNRLFPCYQTLIIRLTQPTNSIAVEKLIKL